MMSDYLEIVKGNKMGLHVKMEGSTAVPPLPWWQKLKVKKNL
jgi:hypothetical protein